MECTGQCEEYTPHLCGFWYAYHRYRIGIYNPGHRSEEAINAVNGLGKGFAKGFSDCAHIMPSHTFETLGSSRTRMHRSRRTGPETEFSGWKRIIHGDQREA